MPDQGRRIRILHCITSLDADGAQAMLLKLCTQLSSRFESEIVNLREPTPFAEQFSKLGITVHHLGMKRALPSLKAMRQLARIIDDYQPDILQGWMYHGNLSCCAARLFSRNKPPILWNIRKAVADLKEYRPLTRLTFRVGAWLSGKVHTVIYCGQYVADQHLGMGYSANNQHVIPNGFDAELFCPANDCRNALRSELNIPVGSPIVGMIARYHPHKDHANFLRSAAIIAESFADVHFVLAGRGLDQTNREVLELATELKLLDRLHLLGERKDVHKLIPAFDVYCLSSNAEGFPNSLGEAMSCGIPCVSTNAGAASEVIGDCGIVVPIGDSQKLAQGVKELLQLGPKRSDLGMKARARVLEKFSLTAVVGTYEDCYLSVLSAKHPSLTAPEMIRQEDDSSCNLKHESRQP